ncbi:hypothetical protein [Candidatus Kuenenia stuttgartiensis]|uniref:hypothetical protein n=1 Tax=Kuenenia stuttgartiensis TaxID=174633 RepID=UPI00146EA3AB|nr:hypothetical protein [Candidatus Kuenenia stuttgartiensis]
MLNATGSTNYTAIAAHIAVLAQSMIPKKNLSFKRTKIQSTNNSNKSGVSTEGEPEQPHTVHSKPQSTENNPGYNEAPVSNIDFVT